MIFDKKRAEMCGPELTVMKFAADGEPLWTRSVAGTAGVLRALAVDAAGDLYAAGSFDGTVNFPTGPLACKSTGRDLVVAKLAGRDGTWIWARQIEGTGEAQACSAAVANGGPLYVAGAFSGAAEFGPNRLTSSGPANGFVCRFDPATGTVGWGRHFGTGDFADLLNAVGIDGGGNIHAVGTAGPKNAFIVNISPTGVVLESITVDAMNGPTSALGAHVDAAGNRYVGGFFSGGEAGFPQRLVKATSKMADGFILKLPPASDKPKASDG
jgi:hypothetical protein